MNVQETSSKSRENLKKEAELIRKEAELAAAKVIDSARRERQTIKEELISLQTQKKSLIARLRHVLTSQLELMDVLELEDGELHKLKDRTKKLFTPESKKQVVGTGNPPVQKSSQDKKALDDVFNDEIEIKTSQNREGGRE
jgi:cell division septum initiation protein DivIVA